MFERIIEIIVFVISELQSKQNITDVDLMQLQNLGYTNSEISTAFSWLADKYDFEQLDEMRDFSSVNSYRLLHEVEEEMFTKEAYGELIQMQTLKLISNEQIESIIERALFSSHTQIDSSKLKQLIANIVFKQNSDFIHGSRLMLNGTDTIH